MKRLCDLKIPIGESARNTLDTRLKDLPKEVKFCMKCGISNQRPKIVFDENNICAPCHFAETKKAGVDWAARKKEFEKMLERFRSKDGSFDVIVPSSGGKDSAAVAHRLKHEYGMHPLCVTWAPMIYTEIGWQNLQNFIGSGFDTILVLPNRILHRKFSKLGFVKFGAHFTAFGRGQMAVPFHAAVEKNIKLVMYGQNGEAEYGGITKYNNKSAPSWEDFDKFYYGGVSMDKMLKVGIEEGYLNKEEADSFKLYSLPPVEKLINNNIEMHWFFFYHKDIPQENYYYASEHTGFHPNPERSEGTYTKFASLDDKTDGFHYYMAFIKFGIGRTTADAVHEVRDGYIAREEAVALIRKYDGEFPKKYFKEFLEYLDLTEDEFRQVIDAYRQEHIWKKENGTWKLRHQVK